VATLGDSEDSSLGFLYCGLPGSSLVATVTALSHWVVRHSADYPTTGLKGNENRKLFRAVEGIFETLTQA